MTPRPVWLAMMLATALLSAAAASGAERSITLASTTSTENSGLFGYLLPAFQRRTGIAVRVIAVGTGQAIRLARNGDADLLMVHHPPSEKKFIADGFGLKRHVLMFNDFIITGPAADPAGIAGGDDGATSFRKIAARKSPFVSRGDDSGTHHAERALWRKAGIDPVAASGKWYREMGAGMGATLNAAIAMNAYVLTDRATWAGFGNKGAHRILVEGDPALKNQYSVIQVNPIRHPHVQAALAAEFIGWLTSAEGQARIGGFKIAGQQVFFPNAAPSRRR